MQVAFIALLIGILIAAVVSFAVMAGMRARRTHTTARISNGLQMRFSPEDPFDVPRRYPDFVLIANGHSPQASNVTYGRLEGHRVRAFDFR